MTRTHHSKCSKAKVIPWTECRCICEGTQHPGEHSFLVPRFGQKNRSDYATAFPDVSTPQGELMRQTFMLVRHTLPNPSVQRDATVRLCKHFGTDYYQGKPKAEPLPAGEIRLRQDTSRRLVAIAHDLEKGRGTDPKVVAALCSSEEPSPELLHFYAMLQCGYLGDFDTKSEVTELVEPVLSTLLPQLLLLFVTGQTAERGSDLGRLLSPSPSFMAFTSDLVSIVEANRTAIGAKTSVSTDELSHLACMLLGLIAEALAIPGSIPDTAAETVAEAVAPLLPASWPKPAKDLALKVIERLVTRVLQQSAGLDMALAPMLALVRLAAVAVCPAIEDHPEVHECLKALTTQKRSDWLDARVKRDVAQLLPLGN